MASQSDRAEKVVRAYRRARKDLDKISDLSAKELLKVIKDFQKEVVERLAHYSPDDPNAPFDVRYLPEILAAINQSIEDLRSRGLAKIEQHTRQSFDLGLGVATTAAVLGTGVDFTAFIPPGLMLSMARGPAYAYTEMTSQLAALIDREIRNQIVGLQSNTQTIAKIAELIASSQEAAEGFRRRTSFASQAELLMRTETGRIFNNAHQAGSEDALKIVPDLRKAWSATHTARRGHLEAEKKYEVGGSIGPIPVKSRFEVTDYSRTGTTEFLTITRRGAQRVVHVKEYSRRGSIIIDFMLFPGDPEASAGNWANCRCISFNVLPDLMEPLDRMAREIRRDF